MSIYTSLSTPIPTIAYCAMHQALPNVPASEYLKTMKELHARIAFETGAINAEHRRFVQDAVQHEVQAIHGYLSTFLHTPISSDDQEIRRILEEGLTNFGKMLLDDVTYGLKYSVEGKLFHVSSKKSMEKKLLQSGKAYLEGLGFTLGKGSADLYESMFVVDGGVNLDVLEHIVRDRAGIYAMPHGKHIKEFGGYAYAAYNLVHTIGGPKTKDASSKQFEAMLFFSKPDMKYAPFRNALVEMTGKLAEETKLGHVSLWQRKLGLGVGKEFVLRVDSDKSDDISAVLQWLGDHEAEPLLKESLIHDGRLVLKEILF